MCFFNLHIYFITYESSFFKEIKINEISIDYTKKITLNRLHSIDYTKKITLITLHSIDYTQYITQPVCIALDVENSSNKLIPDYIY